MAEAANEPMAGHAIDDLPVVWQGSVATWECDQMGHMNTRFYAEKLEEALIAFSRHIGRERTMPLECRFINIRFLQEARAGDGLCIRAGLATHEETRHAVFAVLQSLGDGAVLASYTCALDHAILPPHIFGEFVVRPPASLLPRSFTFDPVSAPEPATLEGRGYRLSAAGAFTAACCDHDGRMRLSQPFARIAEGMPHFMAEPRRIVGEFAAAPKPDRIGGAMLEGRVEIHADVRVGDRFELWGRIEEIGNKTFKMESRMIDPSTRHVLAVVRNVSVVFDLDRRKPVPVTPEAREKLAGL